MKICYIILAHKNPKQVSRLVNRLTEPWTTFYIHIDANKEIQPFKINIPNRNKVVFLEGKERMAGIWGDIGIVKATLNAMRKCTQENKPDIFILLSGQDYPLKNNQDIYEYFNKNVKVNFIDQYPMPMKMWEGGGLKRINRYKINKSQIRGHITFLPSIFDRDFYSLETAGKINFLRKTGRFKQLFKVLKKRKFPSYLKPFGGSVYFALPVKTVEDIIKFVDTHPDYLTYHHYTLSADEIFFHSIIGYLNAKKNIKIEPSLTYVNWKKKNGPPPLIFELEDFEELKTVSEKFLFARKFDEKIDKTVLDKIDEQLLN